MVITTQKPNRTMQPVPPNRPPPEYQSVSQESTDEPPPEFPLSCNKLVIQRTSQSLKENFAVDPRLLVPDNLLPSVDVTEGSRPNLWLQTTSGALNSRVFVFGDHTPSIPGDSRPRMEHWQTPDVGVSKGTRKRAVLVARTTNGSNTLKLTDAQSDSRSPLDVSVSTTDGHARLYLPRSFNGHLAMTTKHGDISISLGIQAHLTMFSDVGKSRRCFIGDFTEFPETDSEWSGDKASIATDHGWIEIAYIDEDTPSVFAKWFCL